MWHWFCESCYNYERMQGLGFCTAMIPLLRKIYKGDDEAMIAAMSVSPCSSTPTMTSAA